MEPPQTLFKVLRPHQNPSNGLLLGHFSAQSAEKMETEIQWMITNSDAWSSSWVSNFSSKLAGKKRRCWKHMASFFTDCRVSVSKHTVNMFESPGVSKLGIQWKQKSDDLLFQHVEKAWQTSVFYWHELQHEVSTSSSCLLSVSSRDWVYKDHAINVSSLKKTADVISIKQAFRYQKIWDVHGHGILLLYSNKPICFATKWKNPEKSFNLETSPPGTTVPSVPPCYWCDFHRCSSNPSHLVGHWHALSRSSLSHWIPASLEPFVQKVRLYRYPCFGIHG